VTEPLTNCHLARPDWELISRSINLATVRAFYDQYLVQILGVPLLYPALLRRPVYERAVKAGADTEYQQLIHQGFHRGRTGLRGDQP